jgi:diacylglycerol kinase (ATP)
LLGLGLVCRPAVRRNGLALMWLGLLAWSLFWVFAGVGTLMPMTVGFDNAWVWLQRLALLGARGLVAPVIDARRVLRIRRRRAVPDLRVILPEARHPCALFFGQSGDRAGAWQAALFSLRNRLASFGYAANGLTLLVRREANARIHLAASLIVLVSAIALQVPLADWGRLVLAMAGVWMAEAFNTAIEVLCDRVCEERDAAIGQAKDLAAGGVLIASIAAGAIGLSVFLPPVSRLLH